MRSLRCYNPAAVESACQETVKLMSSLDNLKSTVAGGTGCIVLTLAAMMPAHAQDLRNQQSVSVGDAALYPSIRIDYQSNDNVGLLADNEIEGSATIVRPELVFVADKSGLVFQAGYQGDYSLGSETPLEWDDHRLSANLDVEFDKRRRANLELRFENLHQELGTDLTRGLGTAFDEPVEFNRFLLDTSFGYGVSDARGNVTAGLRVVSRDYANLDEITDGRGFTQVTPYGQFGYRIGGDTRAIVELRASTANFENDDRDRSDIGVLLGLQFNATGRLSGAFKLGFEDVDFAADGADDTTLLVAEGNIQYRPRSFALLSLDLSRGINNTGLGLVADGDEESIQTLARLGWQHDWSTRVSTDAFVALDVQDEICPTASDSTASAGFELNVAVRRWLQIGAGFESASRQADGCAAGDGSDALDYQRQLLGVHLRATL